MDVSSAFLHADIDTECYLKAPEGFESRAQSGEEVVWKLKKAVYGLKQSPNLWYKLVKKQLMEKGIKPVANEHCIYSKEDDQGNRVILMHHVDDFLLVGPKGILFDKTRQDLKNMFKTKDLGDVEKFLNVNIDRENKLISLSQEHYIKEKLKEYQLEALKPAKTPLSNEEVPEHNQDDNYHNPKYLEYLGTINYLAVWTRPYPCSQHPQQVLEQTQRNSFQEINATMEVYCWND
jgi:hypothetical protein